MMMRSAFLLASICLLLTSPPGLAVAVRLGAINAFLELRGQVMEEDTSEPARFSPIAIGVSF